MIKQSSLLSLQNYFPELQASRYYPLSPHCSQPVTDIIMTSQDVYILISRNWEYVTSHGKILTWILQCNESQEFERERLY